MSRKASSSAGLCYMLRDDVILRDESEYLQSGVYFYRDSRSDETVYLSRSAFELLVGLASAMTAEEAWQYYAARCAVNGDQAARPELEEFLQQLTARRILECADPGARHERPLSHLHLRPTEAAPIKPMTFPSRVTLTLTMRCNMACLHCLYGSSAAVDTSGELHREEVCRLLRELDDNGVISIALSGGEPTTRPDIEDIIDEVRVLRAHVAFFTNGYILRPSLLERLAEVQRARQRGFHVHLSFDGATSESHDWLRGRGAFSRTMTAMKALRSAGISVVVETCLTPCNLGEMEQIASLCAEQGVQGLSVHPVSHTGGAGRNPVTLLLPDINKVAEEIDRVSGAYQGALEIEFDYRLARTGCGGDQEDFPLPPNTCAAGMFTMAVGADGKVYPCAESIGVSSLIMGDVRTASTDDIWRGPQWDIFRGGWTLEQLTKCRGCVLDGDCAAQACRCYAVASGGDFFSPLPDCYANSSLLWPERQLTR